MTLNLLTTLVDVQTVSSYGADIATLSFRRLSLGKVEAVASGADCRIKGGPPSPGGYLCINVSTYLGSLPWYCKLVAALLVAA